ncbi:MAG: hypothetical protein AAF772_11740 [Acidobacteriota bacterium]
MRASLGFRRGATSQRGKTDAFRDCGIKILSHLARENREIRDRIPDLDSIFMNLAGGTGILSAPCEDSSGFTRRIPDNSTQRVMPQSGARS